MNKFKVGDKVRVLPFSERRERLSQIGVREQEFVVTEAHDGESGPYVMGNREGHGVYEHNLELVSPEGVHEVFSIISEGVKLGEWNTREEAVKHASEALASGNWSAYILVSTVHTVTLKMSEWQSVLSNISNEEIREKLRKQIVFKEKN